MVVEVIVYRFKEEREKAGGRQEGREAGRQGGTPWKQCMCWAIL